MEKDKKKGFKWRGMATFLLALGMLVEIISGVILYITPPGRFANWTNWTLLGLNKHEWGALHTIFGYFLLIIIGLHLYFNWRVIVHFVWSRLNSTFNLKRELAVSALITVIIFAGTIWYLPPFSSVMDLGSKAKLSWEKKSDLAPRGGGRWARASYESRGNLLSQQGNGRWNISQTNPRSDSSLLSERGEGLGRRNSLNNNAYPGRGRGRGRMMSQDVRTPGPEIDKELKAKTSGNLKGRDYVRLGKITTLTGTLAKKGDEWEIKTGDTSYEIHLGPSEYMASQGITLTEGANVTLAGFIYGTHVAVTKLEIGGKTITLRDETGRPAWAGSRFGRGTRSGNRINL
ncbi:DUF4405 domain-containing protein [Thermodesulfobacteriota bacterium]